MRKGGRPKGSKDVVPRQTAARKQSGEGLAQSISATGKTPLAIMLEDMARKYEAGDFEGAANRAESCAPYVHARLASTTVTHRDALDDLSVDELKQLLAHAERAAWLDGDTIEGKVIAEDPRKPH